MSGHESQLGRKTYTSSMKSFEIEDPMSLEEEIAEQRRLRASGKEKIDAGFKSRIEALLGMTVLTEEVSFGKVSFILKTLKTNETRQAFKTVLDFKDSLEFDLELRRQFLARAIIKVNDLDLDLFMGSNTLEARLEFVDNLENSLQTALFNAYDKLQKKSEEFYGLKSKEDVEELAKEIKK